VRHRNEFTRAISFSRVRIIFSAYIVTLILNISIVIRSFVLSQLSRTFRMFYNIFIYFICIYYIYIFSPSFRVYLSLKLRVVSIYLFPPIQLNFSNSYDTSVYDNSTAAYCRTNIHVFVSYVSARRISRIFPDRRVIFTFSRPFPVRNERSRVTSLDRKKDRARK